jgi:hypothetical protein
MPPRSPPNSGDGQDVEEENAYLKPGKPVHYSHHNAEQAANRNDLDPPDTEVALH